MDEYILNLNEKGGFDLAIGKSALNNIIMKEKTIPLYATAQPCDVYVYSEVLKWLFKKDDPRVELVFQKYQEGYFKGFLETQEAYTQKYVIGNNTVQENIKEYYINHIEVRTGEIWAGDDNDIWHIGFSCGATRNIDILARIYPKDFEWLLNISMESYETVDRLKTTISQVKKIVKGFKLREKTGITNPPIKITNELVEKYYLWLKENNSINCELEDFTNIFSNDQLREGWKPITWLRNSERGKTKGKPNCVALAAIIVELLDIQQSEVYTTKLDYFFVNKNGDPIKPDIRQNKKNLSNYLPILN